MLYPQNGDSLVTIDSVTSLDLMYNAPFSSRQRLSAFGAFVSAAVLDDTTHNRITQTRVKTSHGLRLDNSIAI